MPPLQRPNQAETLLFMKEHLPVERIISATRERFADINGLLLREVINKHDQGHQFRTAVNAVRAMRQLDFDHREVMRAGAGALVHDVGYNQPDHVETDPSSTDYHGGNRLKFRKHALYGAVEARERLTRILDVVRKRGDKSPDLRSLISYTDEDGQAHTMDESDIDSVVEAILNHNDYGKDDENYDPRRIGKGALMVQMFDKLDHCRERTYPEHIDPAAFTPGSGQFDPKYFHRTVPFCIQDYDFSIDREAGSLKMAYNVDLTEFIELMRKADPDFEYTEADFETDFRRAYEHNCQIAAEAAGVILDNPANPQALRIELKFANGKTREMSFARPNRQIYEEKADAA